MNAERLLAHNEQIGDALDAIVRLRRFILDLAVRGKLVPQDAGDEPVPKRYLNELGASDLPANWRVLNFGKFCDIEGGNQPPKSQFIDEPREGYVQLFQIRDLGERRVPTYIPIKSARSLSKEGDILIGRYGASVGKVFWAQTGAYNVAMAKFIWPHDAFIPNFAFLLLKSDFLQGPLAKATRSAQAGFNKGDLASIDFPLPPLAEQHRIVAKVDELMGLCDRLEAARGSREAVRDRLAAASLARLNAPDPETFVADARFVLDALPALTTRHDQIKQLRQTILNLAVRGKLVPQDAKDEPASELLKRIGAQTNHRDFDAEHELPTSWAWALIEDCFAVSGGMQKTPARTPRANAFPYLGVGNVYRGRLELANVKKFELAAGELERFRLEPEDILVVEGNGSASEIGRCAVWHGEIENCVHQNHLIRCRPKELQLTAYAALYMNSPDGMAEMKRLAITSAGLFSLSVGKIRKIPFPLPPLAEQHRIVAKVDELLALCDRLEASLTSTTATRRRLLDALLAEALAPAEERELEAAE